MEKIKVKGSWKFSFERVGNYEKSRNPAGQDGGSERDSERMDLIAKVYSAAVCGVDAYRVEIEVHGSGGMKNEMVVVGLPDVAVKESRYRVTSAIQNSGLRWPQGRVTINLAPADVRKEGPSFDLPIAVGLHWVQEKYPRKLLEQCSVVGELALTGKVRPVKGVLSIAVEAKASGHQMLIVPEENAQEASLVSGLDVYGVKNLQQTIQLLLTGNGVEKAPEGTDGLYHDLDKIKDDFRDVKGQETARRAVEVGVAGNHHLLLMGSPGGGKSMLARRIPSIMPPMGLEEAIEATRIHSVCGQLSEALPYVSMRPFRAPHHTISDVGLLGGGTNPAPGEISLAHHGVLFLDELPEFRRSTLEVLRQPLEERSVMVTRAAGRVRFPASFMLVVALNPCPCGYYGDSNRACRCSLPEVLRYRSRISGPLLDRIDIQLQVPSLNYAQLSSGVEGESSEVMRQRVLQARAIQQERLGSGRTNSLMTAAEMKKFCKLDDSCMRMMENAMQVLHFSARAYDRILRVARTIADLEASHKIQTSHLQEAIQYRSLDRSIWE